MKFTGSKYFGKILHIDLTKKSEKFVVLVVNVLIERWRILSSNFVIETDDELFQHMEQYRLAGCMEIEETLDIRVSYSLRIFSAI